MKLTEKTFNVELTEREIELLVDALHWHYKKLELGDRKKGEERTLRNDLAGLINRFFMGADA